MCIYTLYIPTNLSNSPLCPVARGGPNDWDSRLDARDDGFLWDILLGCAPLSVGGARHWSWRTFRDAERMRVAIIHVHGICIVLVASTAVSLYEAHASPPPIPTPTHPTLPIPYQLTPTHTYSCQRPPPQWPRRPRTSSFSTTTFRPSSRCASVLLLYAYMHV